MLSEGAGVAGQRESEYHHGKQGHGHGEPEDPAPARHLDEPAAEQRPQHIRHGEHGADDAHVGAELARRHHVGERRLGQDDEAAAPEAGDEAATDEHLHVHGQAAHHLARRIQRERRHEQTLAADKIAQLAVDGHDQRRRQDVGGGDPLHDLYAVQVTHDGGQRRGGDGLGKRADEHGEQKSEEHERQCPAVQGVIGRRRGSTCGFCRRFRRRGGRLCRRRGRNGRGHRCIRSRIRRHHRHRSPLSNQGFLPILERRPPQAPRNNPACAELSHACCALGFCVEQFYSAY